MRQTILMTVAAVAIGLVATHLGALAPLFFWLAVLCWIAVLVWVLHRMNRLPRPLAQLLNRLKPAPNSAKIKAEHVVIERRKLAAAISSERVQASLDEWLVGQPLLTADVARAVELFVGKKRPAKPLSILLAGPAGSGRTTFAEGLCAALGASGPVELLRIDCANDAAIDFEAASAAAEGLPLPILLLDNLDKINAQAHGGSFLAELTRLLDEGTVAGQATMRHAIVILTALLDQGAAADAYREATQTPDELALVMRHAVRSAGRLSDDLINRVDLVAVLKPLEDIEQIAIVWKTFCSMALREHDVTIVEDGTSLGDGIEDFLIEARERWLKAGVSGVREAARFVASTADEALPQASRAGYTHVRARWDPRGKRMRLDQVAPEQRPGRPGLGAPGLAAARHGA
jgi:hypothetical protein